MTKVGNTIDQIKGEIPILPVNTELSRDQSGERLMIARANPGAIPKQHSLRTTVKEIYGKWFTKLDWQPELSGILHQKGDEASRAFGYEPPARLCDSKARHRKCEVCLNGSSSLILRKDPGILNDL
jgi:hypothetical protein